MSKLILLVLLLNQSNILFAQENTNESLFLRDETILAEQHEFSTELGIFYRRQTGVNGATRLKRDTMTTSLLFRYGFSERIETTLNVPYLYVRDTIEFSSSPVDAQSASGLGDARLAFKYRLLSEAVSGADVVLELGMRTTTGDVEDATTPPLGQGHKEYSVSSLIVSSFDPAVYFVQFGFTAVESRIVNGVRVSPGNIIDYRFGSGYALGDNATFSMQLVGSFVSKGYEGNNRTTSRNILNFQVGNTITISKDLFLEPTVSFGLTPESPDVIFGVAFPL